MAVNQGRSESCSNLFFISLSFEHTNDGALTTGSSAQAGVSDSWRDAVFLCVFKERMGEETAASTLAGSHTTKSDSHFYFLTLNGARCGPALRVREAERSHLSERTELFLRAHNKTRQIKERLRDTGCGSEVHSLKVMHCKIAFLLGRTFILCDGCRLTVSANRLGLCV